MVKILLVEDDKVIVEQTRTYLMQYNYEVIVATNFSNIADLVKSTEPDLVLLDIVLPVYNGYHWCQEIRKFSTVPVIFVSSRGENMDIVMGIQLGADDYIVKPYDLSVLVAKIQAVLRRTGSVAVKNIVEFEQLQLNLNDLKLSYMQAWQDLTKTESSIIQELLYKAGDFVPRQQLINACWQGDDFICDNTLAVNINRLRKKLAKLTDAIVIETKKGYGYAIKSADNQNSDNN